ncbi:MAG: trypsin-like peptidase domain-containing protein [Anaerolineae bacterium]|nr:trypsin-like peptidase domain-containing protein [Phycisphaerae bacterium]
MGSRALPIQLSSRRLRLFATFIVASTVFLPTHFESAFAGDAVAPTRPAIKLDDETLELTNLQSRFESIAQNMAPSVVAISAAVAPVDADDALRSEDLNAHKLDAILTRVTRTVGTGFVIDGNGFILTNEHVVGDAKQIWVTTDDQKVYPAIVVGSDPRSDLAVLKIPADKLKAVTFGTVGQVRRGEWTIVLGNPYGLAGFGEMAMSVGVVSAVDRSLGKLSARENRLYSNLIQTTAQINPGNSGGPLFNIAGEVIGLNTAVVMPQKQTNGISFAMPITNELLAKVRDLKEGREVVYGYMGVSVNNPTPRQRREAGAPIDGGLLIESVENDSPASVALMKAGDMLISIGQTIVRDSDQFVRVVGDATVDRAISVKIIRDGKPLSFDLTLRRRPGTAVAVTQELQRLRWRGLLFGPIPANWNRDQKTPQTGVMVLGVDPNSPLADGLASGNVITAIAGKPVSDLLSLQRIINDTPAAQCKLTLATPADANIAQIEP